MTAQEVKIKIADDKEVPGEITRKRTGKRKKTIKSQQPDQFRDYLQEGR